MNTLSRHLIAVALIGLWTFIPMIAQATNLELDLGLGGAIPEGGSSVVQVPGAGNQINGSWNTGPDFEARLMTQANSWLSLGMQFGFMKQSFGSEDPSLTNADMGTSVSIDRKVTQVSPEVELGTWLPGPADSELQWKPYVSFGGGLYNVSNAATTTLTDANNCDQFCTQDCTDPSDLNTCTQTCTNQCTVVDKTSDTSENFGFNVGGGILLKTGQHFAFGPDIEYHQVTGDTAFSYTTASARAAFLF